MPSRKAQEEQDSISSPSTDTTPASPITIGSTWSWTRKCSEQLRPWTEQPGRQEVTGTGHRR
eukprot:5478848-Heterocapsa_arctica.AAC.1